MSVPDSLADLVRRDSRRRGVGALAGRLAERPRLARLLGAPNPKVATAVGRVHARLLRASGGRLRRSWLFAAGQPVAALTTVGRRTGQPRTTPVACFVDGDDLAVAAMNLGAPRDPAWALNLTAEPRAQLTVAGRTIEVVARRVSGEEHARLWRRWVEVQPSSEPLRRRAGREIPIFVLSRR
jgi:deazaflavin-dependent oxidoreductase (nitroreductase family)